MLGGSRSCYTASSRPHRQRLSSFYDYDDGCQGLAKRTNASRWKCCPTRRPNPIPIPLPTSPGGFAFGVGVGFAVVFAFLLHDLRARRLLNHYRWLPSTIYSVTLPRP